MRLRPGQWLTITLVVLAVVVVILVYLFFIGLPPSGTPWVGPGLQ